MGLPQQCRKEEQEEDIEIGTPTRYVPLHHVYSATSPCVSASGSSNVMSKKVKARKLIDSFDEAKPSLPQKPPIIAVYTRRHKRPRHSNDKDSSFLGSVISRVESESDSPVVKSESVEYSFDDSGTANESNDNNNNNNEITVNYRKKRRIGNSELVKLRVDSSAFCHPKGPRLREGRNHNKNNYSGGSLRLKKCSSSENYQNSHLQKVSSSSKRWVRLSYNNADPLSFIGLQCKVYWPLDGEWYSGCVVGYDAESNRHHVRYKDDDEEDLILSNEKIKLYVSQEDMQHLNLTCCDKKTDTDGLDYSEMVVLAASLDDCQDLEPGDIIWAKLTGHAMWPAIVVDELIIGDRKGLNRLPGGKSVPVQFFGSHDFARISTKHVISFLRGLLSSFHLKCKKPRFHRSLEEAKQYLNEQKLPKRMLRLRSGTGEDECESVSGDDEGSDSGEDCIGDERIQRTLEGLRTSPLVIGDLQVISFGKIVRDSDLFQDERFTWPEGYTAVRKYTSVTDPDAYTSYKMEVLRDAESKMRPLFRVTLENGEQFKGSTPSACWDKIFKRVRKILNCISDSSSAEDGAERIYPSGSEMFGFSNPEVFKLIKEMSKPRLPLKFSKCKSTFGTHSDLPFGYRPVRIDWKDLDKCSVCHMDEEYENNLFLQCDKCRMMVHARCYGELEPVDGVLWFCNLCRAGAPKPPPPCCLCPVIGGAMKPTTDGRWAHLACAIWIPETCLSDIKRMEPIDGLRRISKDRWKLLCSICGVAYGACIQCSNNSCRVAYHPLCARAAGLCVELEDEDRLHLISVDDDDVINQCIRLLSFCKKHRQPSSELPSFDERICQIARHCSNYIPPLNLSGCARTEPYDYFGRRGRKEPEALAAASLKRLFVENRPYLVCGLYQHDSFANDKTSSSSQFSLSLQKLRTLRLDAPNSISSMVEKYKFMSETFRKRLTFGKSGIHGFGIFAKHPHRAGDMVIEYTGELVRPPIADRRERLIYNSLVGAGTYMFRIDDERVIDATRAGSIAHLINHSCEPNCYSRVISINGDEHIIIFAKRDIKQWEELTYDYRFFSIDEQLACYCGFPRCRGVVNDIEAEEQVAKLYARRSELVDWREE